MVDLSVSIVNWNGKGFIESCLKSILEARGSLSLEIFVVDNASSDGSQASIREQFPGVILIENRENRGYAAANNQALEKARGCYLLVLNSDTVAQKGSLENMVRFMETHPGVGAVGPKLLNLDGTLQPSFSRRFPNLLDLFLSEVFFLSNIYYCLARSTLGTKVFSRRLGAVEPKEVAWIGGACMLVRREILQTVGGMDEHFFFYREDCDWCLRIRNAGWKVGYYPKAVFTHLWGQSSQRNFEKISFEARRSSLYFFKKHQGQAGFLIAKFLILSGLLLRWIYLSLGSFFVRDSFKTKATTFKKMIPTFWRMRDPSNGSWRPS